MIRGGARSRHTPALKTFLPLDSRNFHEIMALHESNGFILGNSLFESSFENHTIRWSWK